VFGVPKSVAVAWLWLAPIAVIQVARMARGAWKRRGAWESLAFGAVALYFLAMVTDLVSMARIVAK
jgi:hypothetical protein